MELISLDIEVREFLRSGCEINSFDQAVTELILNSLDAEATAIAVRVNLNSYKIQVVDNGFGITKSNMKLIGERFMTSKCRTISDLNNNLNKFGFRGSTLANLIDMSENLTIESLHKEDSFTYIKCFYDKKQYGEIQSGDHRPCHGTTVTLTNFLYTMSVRQKSIDPVIHMEKIKIAMIAIALIHFPVSFTLRDDNDGILILKSYKTNSIYQAFSFLLNEQFGMNWDSVEVNDKRFFIKGYFAHEGYKTKDFQYVYVNKRYIKKSKIHRILNNYLFKRVCILQKEHKDIQQFVNKEIKNKISNPVFIIDISCPYAAYDITLEPSKSMIQFKSWRRVCYLIKQLTDKYASIKTCDSKKSLIKKNVGFEKKLPIAICSNEKEKLNNFGTSQLQNVVKGKIVKRSKIINNEFSNTKKNTIDMNVKRSNKMNLPIKKKICNDLAHKNKERLPFSECCLSNTRNNALIGSAQNIAKNVPSKALINISEKSLSCYINNRSNSSCLGSIKIKNNDSIVERQKEMHFRVEHLLRKLRDSVLNKSEAASTFNKFKNIQFNHGNINNTHNTLITHKAANFVENVSKNIILKNNDNNLNNDFGYIKKLVIKKQLPRPNSTYNLIRTLKSYKSKVLKDESLYNYKQMSRIGKKQDDKICGGEKLIKSIFTRIKNGSHAINIIGKKVNTERKNVIRCRKLRTMEYMTLIDDTQNKDKPIEFSLSSKALENQIIDNILKVNNTFVLPEREFNNNVLSNLSSWDGFQILHSNKRNICQKKRENREIHYTSQDQYCFNLGKKRALFRDDNLECRFDENFTNNNLRIDTFSRNKHNVGFNSLRKKMDTFNLNKQCSNNKMSGIVTPFNKSIDMFASSIENISNLQIHDDQRDKSSLLVCDKSDLNCKITTEDEVLEENARENNVNISISPSTKNELQNEHKELNLCIKNKEINNEFDNEERCNNKLFTIFKRPTFVPKGMSPLLNLYEERMQSINHKTINKCSAKMKGHRTSNLSKHYYNTVINQVDKKFIAAVLKNHDKLYLVMFDQHAVDERIKLENLLKDHCNGRQWKSVVCLNPIKIKLDRLSIANVFQNYNKFKMLGIVIELSKHKENEVIVKSIPQNLIWKSKNDEQILYELVTRIIKEELEILNSTGGNISTIPSVLSEILNLEACHRAIRFGTLLSLKKCEDIISNLSQCDMPFQCAHGRPVMIPLINLNKMEANSDLKVNLKRFKKHK